MNIQILNGEYIFIRCNGVILSLITTLCILETTFAIFKLKLGETLLDIIFGTIYTLRFNLIIENNVDRISYRKHGIQSAWDALPGSDRTARMTPQSFLSILRGECNMHIFDYE